MAHMLRVAEILRPADLQYRMGVKANVFHLAEAGYRRCLLDAMSDMDSLLEVEVLKSLGDMNMEKGRLNRSDDLLNRGVNLYLAALDQCEDPVMCETLEHRVKYAEKFIKQTSDESSPSDTAIDSMARMAQIILDCRKERIGAGNDTDCLLDGHTEIVIEAIAEGNNLLEVESTKRLGDVNLERGRESRQSTHLTKATALYTRALARCDYSFGKDVLIHRLLYAARIRQKMAEAKLRRGARKCVKVVNRHTGHKDPEYSVQTERHIIPPRDALEYRSKGRPFLNTNNSTGPGKSDADIMSYDQHLQTGDRELENGNLDSAEQNFAAALKLVHGNANPSKLREEADCLRKLAEVYLKRGIQTKEGRKFTQASALCHAAMVRTNDEKLKQNLLKLIKETEKLFLQQTVGTPGEPSPFDLDICHKKQLQEMRDSVKRALEAIHNDYNPYQYDEDDPVVREVEVKRAEAIENLSKRIACERQVFIQALIEECIDKLGAPPCKYAAIGLGSQATELVTPYSDLEFAILIEDGKDNDDTRRYFLNLTHYLHLKVINLGETILPAMAIPSLNDFQSDDPSKDWFYDSVTPRGFAFDGFMPWASKTPFGRDQTKTNPPISLIQTPAKLVEYQELDVALAEGYHLSDILRRVSYLAGDQALVDAYVLKVNAKIQQQHSRLPFLKLFPLTTMADFVKELYKGTAVGQLLHVKKDMYRFPSMAVDFLSFICDVRKSSVWEVITELHRLHRINGDDANNLKVLLSISAELRLRAYMANGGQKECLSALPQVTEKSIPQEISYEGLESVFYIAETKMLFRYFYTASPLTQCISDMLQKAVNVPTGRLFDTDLLNCSPKEKGITAASLLQFDMARHHFQKALVEAGSDKRQCGIVNVLLADVYEQKCEWAKVIECSEQALRQLEPDANIKAREYVAHSLNKLGSSYQVLGDVQKAVHSFEQALEVAMSDAIRPSLLQDGLDLYIQGKNILRDNNTIHRIITSSLDGLASCWAGLSDFKEAISYQEKILLMERSRGEDSLPADIATALNNLAISWLNSGDVSKAVDYLEESLKIMKDIHGHMAAQPDIAFSLCNLGLCYGKLGDQNKASSYHQQAQRMMSVIYGDNVAHPNIAAILYSSGESCHDLGDDRKAISYYEQSMNMYQAIYGENVSHPSVLKVLDGLGVSWGKLGDNDKAIKYLNQSLRKKKALHGKDASHHEIAGTLYHLGRRYNDIGDNKQAVMYYEQSLTMMKAVHGENAHPVIARILNHIGMYWRGLGDTKKAISYYEQSLEVLKAIRGDNALHSDFIVVFDNLGLCWGDLGDQRKAIAFFEKSLRLCKETHWENTQKPIIAQLFRDLGLSWSKLKNHSKGLDYYEQSLKIMKSIHGENKAHSDIANLLEDIGILLGKDGDSQKAIRYFEQSLEMFKAVEEGHKEHADIARVLDNLGTCWGNLGEVRKGINFLEQSLAMLKAIHVDDKDNPYIARVLDKVGAFWRQLQDFRKAHSYWEQSLQMYKAIYGESKNHTDIARLLHKIGSSLIDLGDDRKAINYFERSIEMLKTIYGENGKDTSIARSLGELGTAWGNLGDSRKTTSYFEESLEMLNAIGGDNEELIKELLNNFGASCGRLGDHRKAISYFEQSLDIHIALHGEKKEPDSIGRARLLENLGLAWGQLGDVGKSISYFDQSLKMCKTISGDSDLVSHTVGLFEKIAAFCCDQDDAKIAIKYGEKALEILEAYHDKKANPSIAGFLHKMGASWLEVGDKWRAISFCEKAHEMLKAIHGENKEHFDIAMLLQTFGACWSDLGDIRKAISFFERALNMFRATCTCGEKKEALLIAVVLDQLGESWSKMGDVKKSLAYSEQSLEMFKANHEVDKPNPSIARLLQRLGASWAVLGDQWKGIFFCEKALEMYKAIYGENKERVDIAMLLHCYGSCWGDLGDNRRAISFFERSLEMYRSINEENKEDLPIAHLLHKLGVSWSRLGDLRKAHSCWELSLKKFKATYGGNKDDATIAELLFNMGTSWTHHGDTKKGINCMERSLKMYNNIQGEKNEYSVRISFLLRNLCVAWRDVGDAEKSSRYFAQYQEMLKAIQENPEHADSLIVLWGPYI